MATRPRLETFEPDPGARMVEMTEAALAAARQEAYDAGRADANAAAECARATAAQQRCLDIEHNLQTLSFTHEEARIHVLHAVAPLLRTMVERVLPRAARAGLGDVVIDTLEPTADALSQAPVRLSVAPQARAALEAALENKLAPPVAITEDPALGGGALHVSLGSAETRIDLDAVVDEIAAIIEDHLSAATPVTRAASAPEDPQETLDHG